MYWIWNYSLIFFEDRIFPDKYLLWIYPSQWRHVIKVSAGSRTRSFTKSAWPCNRSCSIVTFVNSHAEISLYLFALGTLSKWLANLWVWFVFIDLFRDSFRESVGQLVVIVSHRQLKRRLISLGWGPFDIISSLSKCLVPITLFNFIAHKCNRLIVIILLYIFILVL